VVINCQTITLSPSTLPNGTAGTPYSETITQTGGVGTTTFAVTSGTLPTGLTLDGSTGVLSGTPTEDGTFNFTITATDSNGCTGFQAYTVVIGCPTITLSPSTLPDGTVNAAYSETITATGGAGTVTFAVTAGTLPTGLTLDGNTGVISGTPTEDGSFSFTITATDSNGCTGSQAYTVVINCQTITVSPSTLPDGTIGVAYSQTVTQTGGFGTTTFSVSAGSLPGGLTLDGGTGVISGTPIGTGSFTFTITATDSNGCTGSQQYTVNIGCPTITISPSTVPNGTAGTAYSQTFTQTGGSGTITWSVTGTLPAGLDLDEGTGVLSGTPTQTGTFNFTITATDGNNCTGQQAYTLVIVRAAPFAATALSVDGGGNGVFEPGESSVIVAPSWRNDTGAPEALTGAATNFTGPGTSTYTINDASADYGTVGIGATANCTGADCYAMSVSTPAGRPSTHWDSTFLETLSSTDSRTWTLHLGNSFTDVPSTSGFYRFIETLLHRGVTGGCTPGQYCPGSSTTRQEMAVFVLVAKEGAGFTPPPCTTPPFSDVPVSNIFCPFIQELSSRGVVAGCGPGQYCPASSVLRQEMAVFVLRTLDPTFTPPACGTPVFNDVPANSIFCPWIEELVRRGVVAGCAPGQYCPSNPVTRQEMSVFITLTFGLTLYGL
jgi:hypothetical protein